MRSGRVAWALGLRGQELEALVSRLGLAEEVSRLRERFRREALNPASWTARLDLLGRRKYLEDLGIEREFHDRLRADLERELQSPGLDTQDASRRPGPEARCLAHPGRPRARAARTSRPIIKSHAHLRIRVQPVPPDLGRSPEGERPRSRDLPALRRPAHALAPAEPDQLRAQGRRLVRGPLLVEQAQGGDGGESKPAAKTEGATPAPSTPASTPSEGERELRLGLLGERTVELCSEGGRRQGVSVGSMRPSRPRGCGARGLCRTHRHGGGGPRGGHPLGARGALPLGRRLVRPGAPGREPRHDLPPRRSARGAGPALAGEERGGPPRRHAGAACSTSPSPGPRRSPADPVGTPRDRVWVRLGLPGGEHRHPPGAGRGPVRPGVLGRARDMGEPLRSFAADRRLERRGDRGGAYPAHGGGDARGGAAGRVGSSEAEGPALRGGVRRETWTWPGGARRAELLDGQLVESRAPDATGTVP